MENSSSIWGLMPSLEVNHCSPQSQHLQQEELMYSR